LILAAARQEFGRRGYAGGRVERIAHAAGVNKQLIFYYFGSKAGLFQATVEQSSHEVNSSVEKAEASGGPLEQLRTVLERVFSALSANADLLWATLQEPVANEPPGTTVGGELSRLGDRIRALVSEAQGLGYVRDDVDPGMVAHLAVATVVGSVLLPGPPEEADRRFRSEIDVLVRGLAW
jgi:AcrR family transcriptional regulator